MTVFFLIVFGLYFIGLLFLLTGWYNSVRLFSDLPSKQPAIKKITVVVPFRNELENLARLIADLRRQSLPSELSEMIFVDDHSSDGSNELVANLIKGESSFYLVTLEETTGKKQALTEGIRRATGEIIVTTDADCQLSPTWLQAIADAFHDDNTKMVFGGVRINDEGDFFSSLQAIEFCSLVGSGAAMAGLGIPILSNGANLAFLKTAFDEVEGYTGSFNIPSGDDEFLMHKINRRFPGSIRFLHNQEAVVATPAQPTVASFVEQRLRWAGKWKHSRSRLSQFTAVFVLLVQLSFVAVWFFLPWSHLTVIGVLVLLLVIADKALLEYKFISMAAQFLRVRLKISVYFLLQLIYPFYVTLIGIASLFIRTSWKGRV